MALDLVGESRRMDEERARKMDKAARRLQGGNANAYTSRATAPDSPGQTVRIGPSTLERFPERMRPAKSRSGDETRSGNVLPAAARSER